MTDNYKNETLDEFAKYLTAFQTTLREESERGSAIICATLMEESLYLLIKEKLVPSPEKKIFYLMSLMHR